MYWPSPTASLEQSLRAIWSAVSRAAVLILPQIKLNPQLSSCASFSVDTRLHHLKLWGPWCRSRCFWASHSHPQPLTPILQSGRRPEPRSRDTRHLFRDYSSPSPAVPFQKWMWPWTSFFPLLPKVQSSFWCRTTCPRVPDISPLRQQRRAQCKKDRTSHLKSRKELFHCVHQSLFLHLTWWSFFATVAPPPSCPRLFLGEYRAAHVSGHTWSPAHNLATGHQTIMFPCSCPRPEAGTADGQLKTHGGRVGRWREVGQNAQAPAPCLYASRGHSRQIHRRN